MFADLAQQVATAPTPGTVYERRRDELEYLYAKVPVGKTRLDIFLGRKGEPAAEARAADMRLGAALARDRRSTIAMLKRGGLATPDRMVGVTLDAIAYAGLFRGGAVLVGTAAFMLYEPHVGRALPAPTLMTMDVDLATGRLGLAADPPASMGQILTRADPTYQPVMQLDPREPPSRFRNEQNFLVDLLTPTRHRDDSNPLAMPALEAGAAPLQHLAWLIAEPMETVALWGAGIAVAIPQPARFAVHKLILAQKRDSGSRLKRAKDMAQAGALMAALRASDRFALEDAFDDARAQGKAGWSDLIDRSLAELGEGAAQA